MILLSPVAAGVRLLRLCLLLLPWLLAKSVVAQDATADASRARALVLVSRSPADAWASAELDGMLRVFRDMHPPQVPVVHYLDWQTTYTAEQEASAAAYCASKFNGINIRAVIAGDEQALDFLLRQRDRLFPNAEAVACGIPRLDEEKRRTWLTAVLEQNDAPGTFRLALKLQPQLQRLVIVDDKAGRGQAEKARIEAACPEETQRVQLELTNAESAQALFAAAEKLTPNTAMLLTRNAMQPRVLEVLSQHSKAPIYGLRDPIHLRGIVGGSLLDGEKHGAAAALIAARLLSGEKAATIPIVSDLPHRLVVMYPEAKRAGLSLENLPAGTEIVNRPPTFWRQHGFVILAAAGVILILGAALVIMLRQIRQNRITAAQLSGSLSTLHATFDSTADGVLVVDKDGRVSDCNERFLELWAIPRELATRKHDDGFLRHALLQLKDPSAFLARVRELYSNPDASSHGELIEFKDGRIFERDSRPLRQRSKTMGRVWSFRDVTARVRADKERMRTGDQLAQMQKMEALGNLAGGIAHDFNNILTGVIGYAELAKARLPGRHPAADDLDHVLRASERAKDLVRQILTFSRKRAPEKQPIPLEPVVRDTLKLLRAVVPATIEIRTELLPGVGTVLADPTQIHQAVLNLATNAVHAIGPNGGQITVSLRPFEALPDFALMHPPLRPGSHICLSVTDTGHGMDAPTVKRIFEPFFTTKAPGEGTGLGLAVVHAIVQSHDGVLTVESEVNLGSCFHLYLPVARESEIRQRTDEEHTPEGNGAHILVVDDEAMITEVYRCFLESLDYRVTVAHSPEQALVEFAKCPGDFTGLVTDFNMPHMNGLELVRRLRAIRVDLPALLCTGYVGSAATEHEAAELGMGEILGKPFTRHTLGVALARVLNTTVPSPRAS
jgi:two-component system, cell cycle sensor histidine kinase and response regulator CckA